MKKYLAASLTILTALTLISWGFKGHKAIATIADNYLTLKVKVEVTRLLGASLWAMLLPGPKD